MGVRRNAFVDPCSAVYRRNTAPAKPQKRSWGALSTHNRHPTPSPLNNSHLQRQSPMHRETSQSAVCITNLKVQHADSVDSQWKKVLISSLRLPLQTMDISVSKCGRFISYCFGFDATFTASRLPKVPKVSWTHITADTMHQASKGLPSYDVMPAILEQYITYLLWTYPTYTLRSQRFILSM